MTIIVMLQNNKKTKTKNAMTLMVMMRMMIISERCPASVWIPSALDTSFGFPLFLHLFMLQLPAQGSVVGRVRGHSEEGKVGR